MTNMQLTKKMTRVVLGCETEQQLAVATRYAHLVHNRIFGESPDVPGFKFIFSIDHLINLSNCRLRVKND